MSQDYEGCAYPACATEVFFSRHPFPMLVSFGFLAMFFLIEEREKLHIARTRECREYSDKIRVE